MSSKQIKETYMYKSLVDTILFVDMIPRILWAIGVPVFIGACVLIVMAIYRWYRITEGFDGTHFYQLAIKTTVAAFLVSFFMGVIFAVGSSKMIQPEWVALRMAAPALDSFVEKNPDTLYNPEKALVIVNDTAMSVFGSIQEFPKIIQRLAQGKSVTEVISETAEERERAEFEAWKKSRKSE